MSRAGDWIHSVLAGWVEPRTMERLVEPVIADLRTEHEEAERSGRLSGMVALVRGYTALVRALAAHALDASMRGPVRMGSADRRAIGRTLIVFGLAMTVTTVVLTGPIWQHLANGGGVETLLLLTHGLAISVPVGIVFGVLAGIMGQPVTGAIRRRMLAFGLIVSTASFILLGWGIPVANQAYRQATYERLTGERTQLSRGSSELTLWELRQDVRFENARNQLRAGTVRTAASTYFVRLQLAVAPGFIAMAGMMVAPGIRRRWWTICLMGVGVLCAYCCSSWAAASAVRTWGHPTTFVIAANIGFLCFGPVVALRRWPDRVRAALYGGG